MPALEVLDGAIPLTIRRANGTEDSLTIDVMQVRLALEPVEAKHGCGKEGWRATPEFLTDLAQACESVMHMACTPSVAFAIWQATTRYWSDNQKKMLGQPTSPAAITSTRSSSRRGKGRRSTPTSRA